MFGPVDFRRDSRFSQVIGQLFTPLFRGSSCPSRSRTPRGRPADIVNPLFLRIYSCSILSQHSTYLHLFTTEGRQNGSKSPSGASTAFTASRMNNHTHLRRALNQIQKKEPIPAIDFTIHQLEDGNTISTQERVVKEVCMRASSNLSSRNDLHYSICLLHPPIITHPAALLSRSKHQPCSLLQTHSSSPLLIQPSQILPS